MKKLLIFLAVAAFVSIGEQSMAEKPSPSDNLGALTSYEILKCNFQQGEHASDPSGDGTGPEERVGLANIVERGHLDFTLALLIDLLDLDCNCE